MDVEDRIIIKVNVTQKKITGVEIGVLDPLTVCNILLTQAAQIIGSIKIEPTKKVETPPKGLILPRHLAEERHAQS